MAGSWIGSLIGSGVGRAIGEAATPFTDAWVKTKQSAAATHKVDKETDRDITVAAFQLDGQLSIGQRLLAAADRTHWSTRWIRPAFAALAFVWMGWSVWLWIARGIPLDEVVKYLLAGIVASIFLLRPWEKNKRADLAAAAIQPPKPTLLSRITTRREDSQ